MIEFYFNLTTAGRSCGTLYWDSASSRWWGASCSPSRWVDRAVTGRQLATAFSKNWHYRSPIRGNPGYLCFFMNSKTVDVDAFFERMALLDSTPAAPSKPRGTL